MPRIVCLSMTQPWASLVAIGAKHIETRSWSTQYRGLIAIHASKGFPKDAKELALEDHMFVEALEKGGIYGLDDLPLGAIIAVGKLDDVQPTSIFRGMGIGERERHFGDFGPGRFGWMLSAVHALEEPIPAKGSLGLWAPSPDIAHQLVEFYNQAEGREE